jgi:hypothetical protein
MYLLVDRSFRESYLGATQRTSAMDMNLSGRQEAAIETGVLGAVLATGATLAYTSLKLPLLCPLRTLTGIPCPFCGMTTGTVEVLRGNIGGALAANPFSLGLLPVLLFGIAGRLSEVFLDRPRPRWSPFVRKAALIGLFCALISSWIFQLFRFDVL